MIGRQLRSYNLHLIFRKKLAKMSDSGVFVTLVKLIKEGAASEIIVQRLELAREQMAVLETENASLLAHLQAAEAKIESDRVRIQQLQTQLNSMRSMTDRQKCDHCGSGNIKRIGARNHPTFGDLGVKMQIFLCEDCQRKTELTAENF